MRALKAPRLGSLRVLIALAAALAVVIAGQIPTSAHDDKVYHNDDYARVFYDHLDGEVCDKEEDGHAVMGTFYLYDGTIVTEFDGGDDKCDHVYFGGQQAYKFEICEEFKGCNWEWT